MASREITAEACRDRSAGCDRCHWYPVATVTLEPGAVVAYVCPNCGRQVIATPRTPSSNPKNEA